MDRDRFSMLLLDPGEILFDDHSVQMKEITTEKSESYWLDGRMKVCSKSLVFVPKEIKLPLTKIPFKEIIVAERWKSEIDIICFKEILMVRCKQYIEMLDGNVLAPYKFIHKTSEFHFDFNYIKVADCLPQISQLLRAATLSTAEQNAMIMTIVHSIQSRFSFDTSWLEDLYEEIVCEIQANKILPLVVNPGRILLTTSRIYFQPYNNIGQGPVLKINLNNVINVIRRRFLLRQVGLEIQWVIQASEKKIEHIFFSTDSESERDQLHDNLLSQSAMNIENIPQNQMTMQWQNGTISNYDYLLYINSLADRSFHDLTQYPVMPWIIQDYISEEIDLNDPNIYRDLSKPIGALEPLRLERLRERYLEMAEPKFLYGSHYSAPGFVLFYLVRKYPQYMLCLQNGRFDHPDRMFNSMSDVWKNVLNNMSDFKELIPEFYDSENHGDFLINNLSIDFGFRHDGTKIGDVHIPPWAESPSDFITKLRSALESDWVSKNLHHWIDLIFGYKQKGDEAVKADNVFFHLCYEGAIDLDTIKDINDRHALEVQIMEFGQVPKQIFKLPHPKRIIASDIIRSEVFFNQQTALFPGRTNNLNLELKKVITFKSHKEAVTDLLIIEDEAKNQNVISVSYDGTMKMHSLQTEKLILSFSISTVPLMCCASYQVSLNNNIVTFGSWDNTITFYDVEYGKVIDSLNGHEDVVSCLIYSKDRNFMISGSWDYMAKIWRTYDSKKKIKLVDSLICELEHDSKITCMDISKDDQFLVSGTEDGHISLWDLNSYSIRFMIKESDDKINVITFEPETSNIVCCANNKTMFVVDIHTSTKIYLTTLSVQPLCLSWLGNLLLIGDDAGYIQTWSPTNAAFINKIFCHQGPISSIAVSKDFEKIITGSKDKQIIVWKCA